MTRSNCGSSSTQEQEQQEELVEAINLLLDSASALHSASVHSTSTTVSLLPHSNLPHSTSKIQHSTLLLLRWLEVSLLWSASVVIPLVLRRCRCLSQLHLS